MPSVLFIIKCLSVLATDFGTLCLIFVPKMLQQSSRAPSGTTINVTATQGATVPYTPSADSVANEELDRLREELEKKHDECMSQAEEIKRLKGSSST